MTEMVNGDSSNFQSSNAGTPVSTPSSTPSQAPTESERTFKQSEVNDIAARRANEAIERYKRETSIASHQPSQQGQQYGSQQPQQAPAPVQHQGLSEQEFRRIAAEEAQRSRTEWQQEAQRNSEEQNAQRIASEFFTKVGSGEGGREAFEKTVAESGLDLRTIPHHVQLANMVDNTREVMLELVKNPTKIGSIQNLIDIDLRAGRQPNLAMAEIRRLSETLKSNDRAGKFRHPNEPLSKLQPSNAGTGDQGPRSVGDYKRNPAYKV